MTIIEGQDYQKQSRAFLAQAQEEYEKGDLRQASEKSWGAAAQIVKAVAESRGWDHSRHRLLHQAVSRLGAEVNDPQVWRLFHSAIVLHTNFYEGYLDHAEIKDALGQVSEFVDKVEGLL